VSFQGETVQLKHRVGLQCIAALVDRPGRPIDALDRYRQVNGPPAGSGLPPSDREPHLTDGAGEGPQAVYTKRNIEKLRSEAAKLKAVVDPTSGTDEARDVLRQIDFIEREIRKASGLGGRPAALGPKSAPEKAGDAVRQAIRRVVEALRKTAPGSSPTSMGTSTASGRCATTRTPPAPGEKIKSIRR